MHIDAAQLTNNHLDIAPSLMVIVHTVTATEKIRRLTRPGVLA